MNGADAAVVGAPRVTPELCLDDLGQLFVADGGKPFQLRPPELDADADKTILEWAQDAPRRAPLALVLRTVRHAIAPDEVIALRADLGTYFRRRAAASRRRLRRLLATGRMSLLIGLAFFACATALAEVAPRILSRDYSATLVGDGFVIGGWVALWRPIEILLYDWWPILGEARRFDRLAAMTVDVVEASNATR